MDFEKITAYIDKKVEEIIKRKTSLSIKYWYPTILSAVAITSAFVYWYLSENQAVDQRIAKLELMTVVNPKDTRIVEQFQYFFNVPTTTGRNLDSKSELNIKDLAFTLNNQRKDLIVVITGYSKGISDVAKEIQFERSSEVCEKISTRLIAAGVDPSRIFIQGRGPDVPAFFPGKNGEYNGCVMLCDVYSLIAAHIKI